MKPLITVAINNFNYGAYVGDAIESCLAQTYTNIQVVCVDDGSTDNSREVISRYPSVKAIYQDNGGQSSAARTGMTAAVGEVIIFLDSDDKLHPSACEKIANVWAPGVVSVQFALKAFSDQKGDLKYILPTRPFITNHLQYLLEKGRYPYAPTSGNAFSLVVAREIFQLSNIPDRMYFDACLVFCSPFFGKIHAIQQSLGYYRVHANNVSTTGGKHFTLAHDRMLERVLRKVAKTRGYAVDESSDFMGSPYWNKILKLHMIDPSKVSEEEARVAARRLQSLSFKASGQSLASRIANLLAATLFNLHPKTSSRLYRKARNYGLHRDFG